MPAFSTVPPALSSQAVPVSSVSPASSLPTAAPTSAPTSSFLESLSQPSLSPSSQISASSFPPQPLHHVVVALRGNVTTHPTPSSSTTPTLISSDSKAHAGASSNKWLPGVIVAAVVAVVAAAALATWLTFRRRRRQRYEQARQHDPQLTPDQFRRRSHMSEAALMAEAERERRHMIRKSLLSRSSASLSYLGAAGEVAGEVAGDQGAQDDMEDGYRGVPLYQRQPVPRPPLQPQTQTQPQTQPSAGQWDLAHHDNPTPLDTLAPLATASLIPAPLNVSPPVSAAAAPPARRDDDTEWTAALRRYHPHLTLDNVVEESRSASDQPLDQPLAGDVGVDSDRPASPPVPPRSRLRPLSVVRPDAAAGVVNLAPAGPLRQDSTASQANGFTARQVHADPRNALAHPSDAATTSPTSLYSVDFSQRRRSARRLVSSPTTHSPLFRQLALTILSDKTDAQTSDLTPAEATKSIVLVLDTLDAKKRLASKKRKPRQTSTKVTRPATAKSQPTRTQTKLVAATRKPLEELHNKPSPSATRAAAAAATTKMDAATATATANAGRDAYKENLDNIVMCPDCKEFPPNLVEEFSSGDMVCDSCGLVVGPRIIDSRSEWRTFANDDQGNDDPSRVGESANSLANDEGLRTQVDMRAANGKLAGKLNSINKKSQSEKLNNDLQEGFRAISGLVDMMQTSGIVGQTAMHIYKLAYEHGQLKGKPREAVIAGCIFIACRQCGVPRTFREIYAITRVTKKEIGRVFKSLESFLSKIQEKNPQASAAQGVKDYKASSSTTAEELCTRYCSLLGFRNTPRMEKISKALARKTTGIPDLAGRSPLSVAAACIYFASQYLDDPRASKDIASIAGVSDGTIKTAYRFLYNTRTTLVEPDWHGDLDKLSSS